MEPIKAISDKITVLEAERDFGDITPEGEEMLEVLNFCYDLLTRTQEIEKLQVETPPEMLDATDSDSPFMPQYGQMADDFTDFVFSVITRKGKISLRKVLRRIMAHANLTQEKAANAASIRRATISDYINEKSSLTTDNYEKIINAAINE